jgi:ectoine hydroxylase-related dioxygenase (phytanoyl-CoA dioxygenase family)
MNSVRADIEQRGFSILPSMFSQDETLELIHSLERSVLRRSKAGIRHALRNEAIRALAAEPKLLSIACGVLGHEATPFRATLFDKSPQTNWLVVWHQDTALPLRERRVALGWGPWSVKDGITYAHAPATALSQVLALRIHLDDSGEDNGPLRVLPGSHVKGVLSDDEIEQLVQLISPTDCLLTQGGVVAMRPLIVHASSKSHSDCPRRVIHIEYAACRHFDGGLELAMT